MITTLEDYNKRVNEAVENDLLMFNTNLLNKEYISVYEYFELYKDNFYKDQKIEFKDEFLKIIPQIRGFCVDHEFLIKCEIIQNKDTSYIKDALKSINAKLDIDYYITKTTNKYCLTLKTFQKILMRNSKTEKYTNYYFIIEDIINAYNNYQLLRINKLLSIKNEKINNLNKTYEKRFI